MTVEAGRRSVAVNAAMLLTSQAVTWALAFVLAVALPRHLGPTALGQLRLGVSLWAVAGVAVVFGTNTLLMKEFSRDPAGASLLPGRAATVQLLASGASWVAVGAFVAIAGYDPQVVVIVAILGLTVVLQPFSGNGRAALYGLERMDRVAVVDVTAKAAHVVAVLGLIGLGASVTSIAGATLVPAALAAILMVVLLRRLGVSSVPSVRGIAALARASRQYLAIDFTLVAYQQVDVVVISLLVAERTLGWYSSADSLFASLLFVPTILMTSLFPALSRLHTDGRDGASELLRRSAKLLLLTAVPISLGTVAIAQPVTILLFGPAFAETGPVLAIFGVVLLLTYLTILIGRYAIAVDRQGFWLRLMAVAVLATIALDLVLVPWFDRAFGNGAIGGAVAYLVTESFMLAVGLWKVVPGLVDRAMARRLGHSLAAGTVMLAAVWPLRWSFIALPIVVGAATYVGMVLVLGIPDADERAAVAATGERLRARALAVGRAREVER